MNFTQKQIKDGVRLCVASDDRYKTDYTSVTFYMPFTKENAALAFVLCELLPDICGSCPGLQALNRELDALYDADVDAFAGRAGDRLTAEFDLSALRDKYSLDGVNIRSGSLLLLRALIDSPLMPGHIFPKSAVARAVRRSVSAILSCENDKPVYAAGRCIELMCAGEPYSVTDSELTEKMKKITPESLTGFYLDILLCSPCDIVCVCAPNDPQPELFAMLLSARLSPRAFTCPPPEVAFGLESVRETAKSEQSVLCLGYRSSRLTDSGDKLAFSLFTTLFSSSPSSRLFANVREKLGLCYFCKLSADSDRGITVISCGIDAENADSCREEIQKQLYDIAEGGISDDELQSARRLVKYSYRTLTDTPASVAVWFVGRVQNELHTDIPSLINQTDNITKEQIAAAARSLQPALVYLLTSF